MTFAEIQRILEEKELVEGSQEKLGSGGFEVPERHPRRDVQWVGSPTLKRQILLASKFLRVSQPPLHLSVIAYCLIVSSPLPR